MNKFSISIKIFHPSSIESPFLRTHWSDRFSANLVRIYKKKVDEKKTEA